MSFTTDEASSSSPPTTSSPRYSSWTYHVFLSFRGKETRKEFTDHLCAALERKGIITFRDDKDLEGGEVIKKKLLKAIEESMFAIVILSPDFASSSWCLDELQKIVECKNNMGLIVLPIFYDVEPSHVRYQSDTFGESFRKHELREDNEKVERWRDALRQVADICGQDYKNHMRDAVLVESIAEHIHKKLIPKLPSCTENLVGIASRVEQVYSRLGMGLNDVRFVGIWGIGGIGKTTIARAVYEAIQGEFEVSCHLANVREVSKTVGLVHLQKELGSHLDISENRFQNLFDGRNIIRNSFCRRKVLLVLDDVSEISHLENLAGKKEWFGPGSRVIITTRDTHLLNVHEVHGTYEVEELIKDEALRLFCVNAFKQDQPKAGYLELSEEVVKYSSGLPLALEVLGRYLNGRTVAVWHSALNKLKRDPHPKILDTLRISYDDLDSMQMNVFLDIACFFKGKKRDNIIDILQKLGYDAEIEVDILIERCLVKVTRNKFGEDALEMHDLLQEMGRNIVFQEFPNDPGKRSRLWSQKDIDFVLQNDKGTEAIQGIALSSSYIARWTIEAFSKTNQLKFLCLDRVKLPLGLNCLPSSLKVLHWSHCPLKTLPLTHKKYELVEIKLRQNEIEQLWKGKKFLGKLKCLDLGFSYGLKETPDLSAAPFLETLVLQNCYRLTEIHLSIICHKKLVLLNLEACSNLITLPGKLKMSSLQVLILSNCKKFETLPEFGECMIHLSKISLEGTAIRELPSSIGCLVGLSELNLKSCKELVCIPESCLFPSLTNLDLSDNDFVIVPFNINKISKLRYLKLNCCSNLQVLPELQSSIIELQARCCDSLYTSKLNPLSKICSILTSPRKDPSEVFKMLIPGREIPSWFVHQESGSVVQVPQDCPVNERLGITFCFLLKAHVNMQGYTYMRRRTTTTELRFFNGNSFITEMITGGMGNVEFHLYILYLTNDHISEGTHKSLRFELSILPKFYNQYFKVQRCSARWVCQQDIEDLKKLE